MVTFPVHSSPFDDIDRLFDYFSSLLSDPGWLAVESVEGGAAIDVVVYDDELAVVADLLGFEVDKVHVTIEDESLIVRAERPTSVLTMPVVGEVPLPRGLDADAARVTFTNGVLTVRFPLVDDATVFGVE